MSLIFCCPLPGWPFMNYLCTAIIKMEGKQIRKSSYLSAGFSQGRAVTARVSVFEKILLSWKILHLYTILYHCCKRSDLPSHQINLNPFYFSTLMESSRVLLIYIKIYLLVNLNSSILYLISSTPVISERPWVWALKTYKLRYTGYILQLSDESNLSFIGIWGGVFNSLLRRQTRAACRKELTASQLPGVKDLHWLTAGSKLLFPEGFEVYGPHSLKTSSCELLLPT